MALQRKTNSTELSSDTVLLSESEALEYQLKLVRDWVPKSDVWPFHFSMSILAGCSALSGMYINNHYRKKMRLHSFGRLSTYIPIVVLPGIVSALYHQQLVTKDILIQKTRCPVCVEMRATVVQVGAAVVYPMVLTPLATFTFANYYNTFAVPLLTSKEGRIQAFKIWRKFTQPISRPILFIACFQAFLAAFITHSETSSIHKVNTKLIEFEKKIDSEGTQRLL